MQGLPGKVPVGMDGPVNPPAPLAPNSYPYLLRRTLATRPPGPASHLFLSSASELVGGGKDTREPALGQIQVAGERVYVPARAELNVEHEREGDEEEIEFQLKWTNR
jgi:hypothetical protein